MNALISMPKKVLVFCPTLQAKIDLKAQSAPYSENCQMDALNDWEAVFKWLYEYAHKKNTYVAYKREALRFLLWCSYERGKALNDLKKEDIEAYFLFCQAPPQNWCETAKKETKKEEDNPSWAPFKGALGPSALMATIRILNSCFNYLVQAEYLRVNPLQLIKGYAKWALEVQQRKYQVWARILKEDEWQAIQQALQDLPEQTGVEKDQKVRTQFLFALLYFLGLRIHEVANHTWGGFQKRNNQWWFLVKGKGDKWGHIPINNQLLEIIKVYRKYLGKASLPGIGENEPLMVSRKTKKALKITQLYSLVKAVGEKASQYLECPEKQKKLKAFSPHWLRHLAASHQDRLGMPLSIIQENLRHQSNQTTQLYVHAEDDARFLHIQKMEMQLKAHEMAKTLETVGVEFHLQLKKGPINRVVGLSRVLAGIEQLFKNFKWVRVGQFAEGLLEEVKNTGAEFFNIEIIYQVIAKEVIENPKILVDALKRQCEIWLFDCEVEVIKMES